VSELSFDDAERILHLGPDSGIDVFKLVEEARVSSLLYAGVRAANLDDHASNWATVQ
jgi:hypothetical protein